MSLPRNPELAEFMTEARGALWTGIGCMILAAVIVFVFGMMVIDALPGPGP